MIVRVFIDMSANMTALKIENTELINKIRTDALMNQIYHMANQEGISEKDMLIKAVVILLNLKDEAFQEKVDELMRRPGNKFY